MRREYTICKDSTLIASSGALFQSLYAFVDIIAFCADGLQSTKRFERQLGT